MSTRRRRRAFSSPTLVPLADLLTNTVGITIFIMIFTVLTAGGAVIAKRLPIERPTESESVMFLCSQDRVFVLDENRGITAFREPLGSARNYDDVPEYIKRFNSRTLDRGDVVITGAASAQYNNLGFQRTATLDLAVVFTPKPGSGETVEALRSEQSAFRRFLSTTDSRTHFAYFIVRPDCLTAFEAARTVAVSMGFETGWNPNAGDSASVRFTLTGGGTAPVPQ